jgi:hypothetical protein
MKTSVLGSVAVLSFIGVMSAGCSPMTPQQPKTAIDLESMTSLTTLTAAEPLPPNNAPLEAWGPAEPATTEKAAAEAPITTWTMPPQAEPAAAAAPAAAPAQPVVAPLDPWSYP